VLYTPAHEHFGIVPLEAMARARPVLAVASGGPLETVLHRETGFLSDGVPMDYANAVVLLLTMCKAAATRMCSEARAHVARQFSRAGLRDAWAAALAQLADAPASAANGAKAAKHE
jgi:alpha-1,3/alpha-1,6-mannosyltransferase